MYHTNKRLHSYIRNTIDLALAVGYCAREFPQKSPILSLHMTSSVSIMQQSCFIVMDVLHAFYDAFSDI